MGPRKLTPDCQKAICRYLRQGAPFSLACRMAGISAATGYRWLQRGQQARRGVYAEFAAAVDRAEAEAEYHMMLRWIRATYQPGAYRMGQAARQFLAQRWPERWAQRERHEVTGAEGQPIRIIITKAERPPEDAVSAFD